MADNITKNDICYLYRFILRREPENLEVVNSYYENFHNIEDLLNCFRNSTEFRNLNDNECFLNLPISELKREFNIFKNLQDAVGENNKAVLKQIILEKWRIIDTFDHYITDSAMLNCILCNAQFNVNNAKKYESDCIFAGGHLIRYRCPECGAIIGPLKMLRLSKQELDEEYNLHYSVFAEGDSTEAEEQAFYSLNPTKEKVYLNYGCGSWSKTINNLRKRGFTVYGYEPYAEISEEFIITDVEKIRKMRFDGIFSNNLIEHFRNPIDEFLFMKSLLLNKESLMVHSTACFEYLYEYTRFHLLFYTGNSVNVLCKKTGLEVVENKRFENHDIYIIYTFRQA